MVSNFSVAVICFGVSSNSASSSKCYDNLTIQTNCSCITKDIKNKFEHNFFALTVRGRSQIQVLGLTGRAWSGPVAIFLFSFPYLFLNLEFVYFFYFFFTLIFFFFLKEFVWGIEPQTNNHKPNYQTTRPARDELPETRF